METKTCKTCKTTKPILEFVLAKTKSGRGTECKPCKAARSREYEKNNIEKVRAAKKKWRDENKEHQRALVAKWASENVEHIRFMARQKYATDPEAASKVRKEKYAKDPEKYREYARQWRKDNKSKNAELSRRYAAVKLQAMPKWADVREIVKYYELARQRTKETGIQWHVDHIVPLKGKLVCGLHNQFNLQVIPANDNIRKGNKLLDAVAVA